MTLRDQLPDTELAISQDTINNHLEAVMVSLDNVFHYSDVLSRLIISRVHKGSDFNTVRAAVQAAANAPVQNQIGNANALLSQWKSLCERYTLETRAELDAFNLLRMAFDGLSNLANR